MREDKYLLDTNICIALLQNKWNVRERIREIGLNRCFVSEITIAELFYGASKSKRKKEQIRSFCYPASVNYGNRKY